MSVTHSGVFIAIIVFASATSATGIASAGDGPGNPSGQAAGPSHADRTRANDLFKKSIDAYRRGDFKQAIDLLDEAYALAPQPVLVYNRARAEEGLGNTDEAIKGYETYLQQDPNAVDRGAIEQRLATLKHQQEDKAKADKERAAPKPAPIVIVKEAPPAPPRKRSVLPYVVVGVGGAGLATGTIFGFMALSKKSAANTEPTQQKSIDLKDTAHTFATVSTISFIVGAVLVAGGATWWVLDTPPKASSSSAKNAKTKLLLPLLGPTFAGVGGSFQ